MGNNQGYLYIWLEIHRYSEDLKNKSYTANCQKINPSLLSTKMFKKLIVQSNDYSKNETHTRGDIQEQCINV